MSSADTFSFSCPNNPKCFSVSSQERCFSLLIIWTHLNRSTFSFFLRMQSWTQHCRWVKERGRIPSFSLLPTLLLLQPKMRMSGLGAHTIHSASAFHPWQPPSPSPQGFQCILLPVFTHISDCPDPGAIPSSWPCWMLWSSQGPISWAIPWMAFLSFAQISAQLTSKQWHHYTFSCLSLYPPFCTAGMQKVDLSWVRLISLQASAAVDGESNLVQSPKSTF